MKADQKYTPKYWVGHNKTSDDVYPSTMAKGFNITRMLMEGMFGEAWYEEDDLEIILIEIKMIPEE